MGILDFVKGQFIEVIEWLDDMQDTIVYRFPVQNQEIKMGAKLTVRESQMAIFVNEGTAADVFGPGLYTLETENMPVLTKLKSWPYGFKSPFKAEVYFVNTKQFTDQKWGTENPIMLRDADFGMLRLRAFGIYAYKVGDPLVFMQQVSGTDGLFDTKGIAGQLKRSIVSGLTDLLGELKIPALDLAANYDEISENAKDKLQEKFGALGLQLVSFYVENISLPEEVEKALDKRTQMGVIGNMQTYAQYQAADALKDAAKNPGGLAGAGVGLGAGVAMGSAFSQVFTPPQSQTQQMPEQTALCRSCGAQIKQSAKFCPECGQAVAATVACTQCNKQISAEAKFCPECGAPRNSETVCKGCGNKLEPGTKFCPDCGTKA